MPVQNPSRWLACLPVLVCVLASGVIEAEEASQPPKSPKPELLVSMAHSAIRENDQFPVRVWIANDSEILLDSLHLRISSPEILEWLDTSCAGPRITDDVSLGTLAAHAVVSKTLCVKSGSTVEPGSLNILFTANFTWKDKDKSCESFVSSEKPLTVALLGTDTLGGVPLGIAALVVPGLLFWLIVNAFGASWGPGIALGDKMIYSVLVSALIMSLFSPIPYLSMRTGLSIWKLVDLALIGAGLGFVAGVIDLAIRRAGRTRLEARTVHQGDDYKTVLGKLLRVYADKSIAKTTVRLKDGKQFIGSLGEERTDLVVLVGSFRVGAHNATPEVQDELKRLAEKKGYVALFELAERKGLSLELSDAIKTVRAADGQLITTAKEMLVWKPDEVEEVAPVLGDPKSPPIGVS